MEMPDFYEYFRDLLEPGELPRVESTCGLDGCGPFTVDTVSVYHELAAVKLMAEPQGFAGTRKNG